MAVKRTRTKTRTTRRGRAGGRVRRTARKAQGFLGNIFDKKTLTAGGVGIAISQGSALASSRVPQHARTIREAGHYAGMIAAAKKGGVGGVVVFAIGNAIADRYLRRALNQAGMGLQGAGAQVQAQAMALPAGGSFA